MCSKVIITCFSHGIRFSESLNIPTDSQYADRVVFHIETAEVIPNDSELTFLFMQL